MKSNLLPVAKEGINYILGAIFAFILFSFLNFEFLEFISFLLVLFFIFVFRNPERENISFEESSVTSPVDGVVVSIEELEDSNYGFRVDIDSTYFNVSLLRVPLKSSVSSLKIRRGSRLSALTPLSKSINEHAEIVFKDTNSNNIKVVHRLNRSFKSIDIDAKESQNLYKGSRYGLMIDGTTSIFLPHNFRLNISVGSNLVASEDLIGYFTN